MIRQQALLCALLLSFVTFRGEAQDDAFVRFGLYVVVSDLDKAAEFYQRLFGRAPYVKNERLVGFDVAGGLFALFTGQPGMKTTRGENVVPYLRVRDIEREFARVKTLDVRLLDAAIVQEGPLRLFRFADPDGNVIEYFTVAPPPSG